MDPEQPAQEERKRMYKQQKHSTFPPEAEPSKQQTAAEQTLKLNADSHPNNDACLGLKHRKKHLCHAYNLQHAHPQDLFRQERMHCLVCARGKTSRILRTRVR